MVVLKSCKVSNCLLAVLKLHWHCEQWGVCAGPDDWSAPRCTGPYIHCHKSSQSNRCLVLGIQPISYTKTIPMNDYEWLYYSKLKIWIQKLLTTHDLRWAVVESRNVSKWSGPGKSSLHGMVQVGESDKDASCGSTVANWSMIGGVSCSPAMFFKMKYY